MITNQSQCARAAQALTETNVLIAKEQGYLPKHQKREYLVELEAHAAKLTAMLKKWRAE